VEATVTPDNSASAALFRSLAARHDTAVEEEPAFAAELFPGGHDAEVRFRIGPLGDRSTRRDTLR
jgi:L-2,4-diaminobutyric acid acetyltransferase